MNRQLDPEKREKFMQAALKLFVANGVPHTSTAAISREAGTAAGTLFNYFPTKQDLVDELALDIARSQAENINAHLTSELDARGSFQRIYQATIEWFLAHTDAYRFIQQVRDSGELSPRIAEETGRQFAFYYQAIQKGLQEDSIKSYPVDLIGNIFYFQIVAVMNILLAQPDQQAQSSIIEAGFAIFWDGIRK